MQFLCEKGSHSDSREFVFRSCCLFFSYVLQFSDHERRGIIVNLSIVIPIRLSRQLIPSFPKGFFLNIVVILSVCVSVSISLTHVLVHCPEGLDYCLTGIRVLHFPGRQQQRQKKKVRGHQSQWSCCATWCCVFHSFSFYLSFSFSFSSLSLPLFVPLIISHIVSFVLSLVLSPSL